MASSMKPYFYGILPSHIYKNMASSFHQFFKKNTVLMVKGDKINPVLQIRLEVEVIKIYFLIETHKQISM